MFGISKPKTYVVKWFEIESNERGLQQTIENAVELARERLHLDKSHSWFAQWNGNDLVVTFTH